MATGYWLLAAGNPNRRRALSLTMRLPEARSQEPKAIKKQL